MILLLLYEYSLSGGDTQTLLAGVFFLNFLRSQAASDANIGIIVNFV